MTQPTDMPKDSKPVLTPKLRFPEFRNSSGWQEKQIGEICRLYQAETISSSEFIPNGAHLVYGANGVVGRLDRYNHEDEEVIVSCRGVCGEVHFTKPRSWITGNSMVVAPRTDDLQKPFLYRLLSAANLKPIISGSAQPQITRQGFSPFLVHIPSTLAEQQKIAECLSTLDELIGAESQKLDALKAHKKGLMQQLFPREGETLPRLRFPEFQSAPEWETDKLGSVCDLYQPVTLSSAELSMTGEYLVYGANGIIGSHNQYNHEDSEIAVTCRGATCGEVTKTKPKSWITGNAMVVKPKSQSLSKDFIFHYFKNHGLKSVISGSAQPQITRAGFSPLVVSFPKPDEQHRIATCLSSLDELIAAQSDRISALQTHKQGLLQQLFPSSSEVES